MLHIVVYWSIVPIVEFVDSRQCNKRIILFRKKFEPSMYCIRRCLQIYSNPSNLIFLWILVKYRRKPSLSAWPRCSSMPRRPKNASSWRPSTCRSASRTTIPRRTNDSPALWSTYLCFLYNLMHDRAMYVTTYSQREQWPGSLRGGLSPRVTHP